MRENREWSISLPFCLCRKELKMRAKSVVCGPGLGTSLRFASRHRRYIQQCVPRCRTVSGSRSRRVRLNGTRRVNAHHTSPPHHTREGRPRQRQARGDDGPFVGVVCWPDLFLLDQKNQVCFCGSVFLEFPYTRHWTRTFQHVRLERAGGWA